MHDNNILYEAICGSRLYGMANYTSDYDIRGVYLADPKEKLLAPLVSTKTHCKLPGRGTHHKLPVTDQTEDSVFWELTYWLSLIRKGDTNAIDLLFAQTYPKRVLSVDNRIRVFLDNPLRLFNPCDSLGYLGFAMVSIDKYRNKGARYGALVQLTDTMNSIPFGDLLEDHCEALLAACKSPTVYLETKQHEGVVTERFFVVNDKKHLLTITIGEFYRRVQSARNSYGKRTKTAHANHDIDWKALRNSVRAVYQYEQLLRTGEIKFPLNAAGFICDFTSGGYSVEQIIDYIDAQCDRINALLKKMPVIGKYDEEWVHEQVMQIYLKAVLRAEP
jgi:hypothetical protein